MLVWKFSSGIEKDLENVAEGIVRIMKEKHIHDVTFTLLGFNAVTVGIVKIGETYEVRLIDEDPYDAHYLNKEEYAVWKEERKHKQENGFITNPHATWNVSDELSSSVQDMSSPFLALWKEKRQNEIQSITYQYRYKEIVHDYDDKAGFTISEYELRY